MQKTIPLFASQIIIFILITMMIVSSALAQGLDLWNNDNVGGSPANAAGPQAYKSLSTALHNYPHIFTPQSFVRTFHVFPAQVAGHFGSGETIAFLEWNANFDAQAFRQFNKTFHLPNAPQTRPIVLSGNHVVTNLSPSRDAETMLDVEWAHVIAPRARLVILDMSHLTFGQVKSILWRYHVTVVSSSISTGSFVDRSPFTNATLPLVTRIQFTTWIAAHYPYFVSSGDGGSNVNPAIVSPNAVMVGGIQANQFQSISNLKSYQVWPFEGLGIAIWDALAPSYQRELAPHPTWRHIPDVTWLSGYPGVLVILRHGWIPGVGTSLSTPSWAALWALADNAHRSTMHSSLAAEAAPTLYAIASKNQHAFISNTRSTRSWQKGWGLGFPNPPTLIRDLASYIPLKHHSTHIPGFFNKALREFIFIVTGSWIGPVSYLPFYALVMLSLLWAIGCFFYLRRTRAVLFVVLLTGVPILSIKMGIVFAAISMWTPLQVANSNDARTITFISLLILCSILMTIGSSFFLRFFQMTKK